MPWREAVVFNSNGSLGVYGWPLCLQGFSMEMFAELLESRQGRSPPFDSSRSQLYLIPILAIAIPPDEICGDAFDMLMTLGDFDEFKELMLEHKRSGEAAAAGTGLGDLVHAKTHTTKAAGAAAIESPEGKLSSRLTRLEAK